MWHSVLVLKVGTDKSIIDTLHTFSFALSYLHDFVQFFNLERHIFDSISVSNQMLAHLFVAGNQRRFEHENNLQFISTKFTFSFSYVYKKFFFIKWAIYCIYGYQVG